MKLLIEVYGVTDLEFEDEFKNILPIEELCNKLDKKLSSSYIKNKVELNFINVLKDPYDEAKVKDILSQGYHLPWTLFNGEIMFYNGFSISMIYKEALREMSYKVVNRNIKK
ncbi:MAG: hypothetical protein K0Q49_1677 [Haloplasmataceae bacterium]|jgi:hypothetical protein|nr:hypothetical protein [Haloplasmataceae bacterium]